MPSYPVPSIPMVSNWGTSSRTKASLPWCLEALPIIKRFFSRIKNIIIEIFERSAHSPQQEEAPRFTEALLRWYNAIVFK